MVNVEYKLQCTERKRIAYVLCSLIKYNGCFILNNPRKVKSTETFIGWIFLTENQYVMTPN